MDLTLFFSPIDDGIYGKPYPINSFFKSIRVYKLIFQKHPGIWRKDARL